MNMFMIIVKQLPLVAEIIRQKRKSGAAAQSAYRSVAGDKLALTCILGH